MRRRASERAHARGRLVGGRDGYEPVDVRSVSELGQQAAAAAKAETVPGDRMDSIGWAQLPSVQTCVFVFSTPYGYC